jgi:serine/threonine protein kinase
MGVVHRAVDTKRGRQVAIKVLPAHATSDPERRRRFIQEARAASALNHPHIVTIHEIDEHEGTIFIAMEFVDGTPLDRLLASGPIPIVKGLEPNLDVTSFEFIVRSGRALLYPVYQGTFERGVDNDSGPSAMRDRQIQWAKDFFRAVDYLDTRKEIDMQRLAYDKYLGVVK